MNTVFFYLFNFNRNIFNAMFYSNFLYHFKASTATTATTGVAGYDYYEEDVFESEFDSEEEFGSRKKKKKPKAQKVCFFFFFK